MRTYEQLSRDERYQIKAELRAGKTVPAIAKLLGRSSSTIYRELERNSDPMNATDLGRWPRPSVAEKYHPERAQNRTAKRRIDKGAAQRKIRGELQTLVEDKLRLSWSPQQICGRLRHELDIVLSHETIYQHILRDTKRLGFYRYCLRFAGYKHHRFKKSRMAERTRQRKRWIETRPRAANERTELGHWERDCLLGERGGSALVAHEDRTSRYVIVRRVPKCDVANVSNATVDALAGQVVKTVTNDNGIEFARDESLSTRLECDIFFCNPHSPWERGSVENTNGLIRQYLGKGCDLDSVPGWMPAAVEETLNHRPRGILHYLTPHEVHTGQRTNLIGNKAMHFGLEFSVCNRFRRYLFRSERTGMCGTGQAV